MLLNGAATSYDFQLWAGTQTHVLEPDQYMAGNAIFQKSKISIIKNFGVYSGERILIMFGPMGQRAHRIIATGALYTILINFV